VTLAFALALWRGVVLRIALVVGFVVMALSHVRNAEVLALLGPMVIAAPRCDQTARSHQRLAEGVYADDIATIHVSKAAPRMASHRRSIPSRSESQIVPFKRLNAS
jgi:hypothetical protein